MMWNYPYGYMNAGWFLQPFLSILVTVLVIIIVIRIFGRHGKRQEFLNEIKDFKDKLTKFQSSIDTKIKEAKEAKLKADKEAAQAKIDALKKQIEDAAAELKKLEELEQK